jgi:hypothetical protein
MNRGLNILWVPLFVFLLSDVVIGAERNARYSIALKGTYTSTSKLFPTPDAALESLRNRTIEFNDLLGMGLEIRRRLSNESIEVGLGVEFLRTSKPGVASGPGTPTIRLPIEDGYRFIPLELTGYFIIPFSSEKVKLFMGGGTGFYYGDRIYRVVDRSAQTVETQVAFGIHVLAGMDYFFSPLFSLRGELKFRDPQFNITSRFTATQVEYNGNLYRLSQQPFVSKVNLDGLVITLGTVLNF